MSMRNVSRLALLCALSGAGTGFASPPGAVAIQGLPGISTTAVSRHEDSLGAAYEGVVQAVRQTAVAAQVMGTVSELHVHPGDKVRAGQVLLRIDARAADQAVAAGEAQARSARAALDAAAREYERQKRLFEQRFISQAALDNAETHFKTAQAEAAAQLANADAAKARSEFHVVRAPYGGVVAEVPAVLGDMAMPGRPLVILYDPSALRVSAAVAQTVARRAGAPFAAQVEIPALAQGRMKASQSQLLPTVDPASHTVELRIDLPSGTNAVPGMFARVWLAGEAAGDARLFVPANAVVRRSEFAAVYVIGRDGRPLLRQVRAGRSDGTEVEILSGVGAGERVALDPQAAARIR